MPRITFTQSKHDARVEVEATSYYTNGYEVWADISGWPQPSIINGYRPDVIAVKGIYASVVEVETPDSVSCARDLAQLKAFRIWANSGLYRYFRRVVTA